MSEEKILFPLNSEKIGCSFIATADLHLGKKLYNKPELEEDLKDNLRRLADMAIAKKVDYLVIAGDLYEDNNVKPHMIAFVAGIADKLRLAGVKMVGIAGDHDKPIRNEAWVHISKISPVTIEPSFAGIDYFDYSTVSVEDLIKLITQDREPDKVEWLFLHCQFPQVFDKAEPKKLIDFNKLNLFEIFPNIKGVIAGDLHFGPETMAYGVNRKAWVGYPGSLGVLDKSEFYHKKHVLYCDGHNLISIPFPFKRIMREIDFRGKEADDFDVDVHIAWAKSQKLKPIVYLYYDTDSESQIFKTIPLHDVSIVKQTQVPIGTTDLNDATIISCRTEASSEDKIDKALKVCCEEDTELYTLTSALLKDDLKEVLDNFKTQFDL